MSDRIFGSIPTGRRLEQNDFDPRYVGSVGPLRKADPARLRLARRNLTELREQDIEGSGLRVVAKTIGTEWEVATEHVDLVDPGLSGVTAFVVRDGWLVPLRSPEWKPEAESVYAGSIEGREARPSDPMPRSEIY